jgi:hypothetical protein
VGVKGSQFPVSPTPETQVRYLIECSELIFSSSGGVFQPARTFVDHAEGAEHSCPYKCRSPDPERNSVCRSGLPTALAKTGASVAVPFEYRRQQLVCAPDLC